MIGEVYALCGKDRTPLGFRKNGSTNDLSARAFYTGSAHIERCRLSINDSVFSRYV